MRWQWVYNTKRKHSTINMTPRQKLLSYRPVPKYTAIFPVTNLDTIGAHIEIFFPSKNESTGGNVSTDDLLVHKLGLSVLLTEFSPEHFPHRVAG